MEITVFFYPHFDQQVEVKNPTDKYDPSLLRLNSVEKFIGYCDSVYGWPDIAKNDSGTYANIVGRTIRYRFYHGYSWYHFGSNYVATLLAPLLHTDDGCSDHSLPWTTMLRLLLRECSSAAILRRTTALRATCPRSQSSDSLRVVRCLGRTLRRVALRQRCLPAPPVQGSSAARLRHGLRLASSLRSFASHRIF